jgi:glycosyltransferase involved in cell wall biosynthesis
VLLPVRDAATTLPACLRSLSRQTLKDHEVVAIDDGSSDTSGELLEAFARKDPRLRVVHTPRLGLVPALQRALGLAQAELVARMDADDLAHRDRLALQRERLFAERQLTVVGCRVAVPADAGEGMKAYVAWSNGLLDHERITADLHVESPLVHPSVMMRASALRQLGGWREFPGPEDYDLWLRGYAAGWRFAKREETLLVWRDSALRLTRTDPRYQADRFFELKLESLRQGPLRAGRPVVLWGAGPVAKAWSRALRGLGHKLLAWVEVDRRKIGNRVHGAEVVGIEEAGRFPQALHLAAVGQRGARERIRENAQALGLREGEGFVAVA